MIEKPETIAPGECFYSPDRGMDHYYIQREVFVLHINVDADMINTLDKDFLRAYPDELPRVFHQITQQQLYERVLKVINSWQLPPTALPLPSN